MRTVILALAILLGGWAVQSGSAQAQVTYSINLPNYVFVAPSTLCTVGDCGDYTLAMEVTGTVTFAAPLAPNLVNADVSLQLSDFAVSDGVRSYTPVTGTVYGATVSTNGAGTITNWSIGLQKTPGPPYTINDPGDPNSRYSFVLFGTTGSTANGNYICAGRGPGSPASGPGSCNGGSFTDAGSTLAAGPPGGTLTLAVATVPTLSEWAMILLGLMLAGLAGLSLRRRVA